MSTAVATALASSSLQLGFFVEANFKTGPIYIWSGRGSLSWSGKTWVGLGTLGHISPIADGAKVQAQGCVLTLSGIDSTLLADVLGEFVLHLPVKVYLGLFNAGVLIADPLPAFIGRMDQPAIDIDGQTSKISINCETRLLDMDVAVDRRYTQEDQQRDWPGDLGFSFVNAIQEMTLYWGMSPTSSNNV